MSPQDRYACIHGRQRIHSARRFQGLERPLELNKLLTFRPKFMVQSLWICRVGRGDPIALENLDVSLLARAKGAKLLLVPVPNGPRLGHLLFCFSTRLPSDSENLSRLIDSSSEAIDPCPGAGDALSEFSIGPFSRAKWAAIVMTA